MENKKKKNIVIIALCLMVVFVSVGYAALSQTLIINGTGNVSGNWNIEIIDIGVSNNGNAKTPTATNVSAAVDNNDKTRASFSAQLLQPGDYITYDVTVKNKGTIDAYLSSITLTPDHNDFITFTTTANTYLNTVLAANQQITFTVTASFPHKANDTMPTNDSDKALTAVLTLNYVQSTQSSVPTPGPIDDGNGGTSPAALTFSYPASGTLSDGTTYTLTSDGKLVLDKEGEIQNEDIINWIAEDAIDDYLAANNITGSEAEEKKELLGPAFTLLYAGYSTYADLPEAFADVDEGETPPTQEEINLIMEEAAVLQNVVPVTTIEFSNTVTAVDSKIVTEIYPLLNTVIAPQGLDLGGFSGTVQRSN